MNNNSVNYCFGLTLCCLLLSCDSENSVPESPSGTPAFDSDNTIQLNAEQANAVTAISDAYLQQIDADLIAVEAALSELDNRIEELLRSPDEARLLAARQAWIEANVAYELTSIHRYFADTILSENQALRLFQIDYQLNHWPILPGYIDYVADYPNSGMVNDMTVAIEANNLRAQHGAFDANEAAIGFHVIEFMLWGESSSEGLIRPASDYEALSELSDEQAEDGLSIADLSNNRRREFLRVVTASLRSDFASLVTLWHEGSAGYRSQTNQMPAEQLLFHLLEGITRMMSEEILAGSLYLMLNGEFEDSRPSLFSDTSQHAVSAQLSGLERLLLETGSDSTASLDSLLNQLSTDYGEFFLQNFDTSKECLVVVYSVDTSSAIAAETEFKVVECINSLTNMLDYLQRIKLSAPQI